MKYKEYLKSKEWKKKRKKKIKSRKRCFICKRKPLFLDVHHINYKNLYNVHNSDLIAICRRCHTLVHELMKSGEIRFKTTTKNWNKPAIIRHRIRNKLSLKPLN